MNFSSSEQWKQLAEYEWISYEKQPKKREVAPLVYGPEKTLSHFPYAPGKKNVYGLLSINAK
ncbi:hypothetical protein CW304_30610 [Bacillus sp. UFRGS-B20]|nr:hypothetical protein CW304_30610 [Bacillus sp. UFRGS-B20]